MIVYRWNRGPPRTAGALRRGVAFAFDAGLVLTLAGASAWGATWAGLLGALGGLALLRVVGLFALPIFLVYFTLFEAFGGRTPGKMLLGLRVARLDGANDLFHSFLRNLLRLLWATPLGPAFVLADAWALRATELDQRVGDLAAGTVVLDERATPQES